MKMKQWLALLQPFALRISYVSILKLHFKRLCAEFRVSQHLCGALGEVPKTATRESPGTISFRSSSRFALIWMIQ